MLQLVRFWYLQSPIAVYNSLLRTLNLMESTFAIQATIKNLGKPLFQDYTLQGRFIGFILRLVRIGAGIVAYSVISIIYLFGYLIWLLFPLICLVSILGSIFGPMGYNLTAQ